MNEVGGGSSFYMDLYMGPIYWKTGTDTHRQNPSFWFIFFSTGHFDIFYLSIQEALVCVQKIKYLSWELCLIIETNYYSTENELNEIEKWKIVHAGETTWSCSPRTLGHFQSEIW